MNKAVLVSEQATTVEVVPNLQSCEPHTQVASGEKLIQLMSNSKNQSSAIAMYNSIFDAIVDEPHFMAIPLNDRLISRSHGVHEIISVKKLKFFNLNEHLQNLQFSTQKAKFELPFDLKTIQVKLNHLVAFSYSKLKGESNNFTVCVFVSNGRSPFDVFPTNNASIMYAVCYPYKNVDFSQGVKDCIINNLPNNPQYLNEMKSTNYLLNTLCVGAAREKNGYFGIVADESGNLLKASFGSIAFIYKDNTIVEPEETGILHEPILRLCNKLIERDLIPKGIIKSIVKTKKLLYEEVIENSLEMLIFFDDKVISCTQLNDKSIGNGCIGPMSKILQELLEKEEFENSDIDISVYAQEIETKTKKMY